MAAKYEIKKFNENNFSLWKMKTQVILRKNNCLATIGEKSMKIRQVNEMDGNVIANLHLTLADVVLSNVNAPPKRAEEKSRRNKRKRDGPREEKRRRNVLINNKIFHAW